LRGPFSFGVFWVTMRTAVRQNGYVCRAASWTPQAPRRGQNRPGAVLINLSGRANFYEKRQSLASGWLFLLGRVLGNIVAKRREYRSVTQSVAQELQGVHEQYEVAFALHLSVTVVLVPSPELNRLTHSTSARTPFASG